MNACSDNFREDPAISLVKWLENILIQFVVEGICNLNSVPFTEEGLKSMITTPEKQPLTDEEFEALYLAYSKVNINEKTQSLESNFVGKVKSEVMRGRKTTDSQSAIIDKLLSNPSPQVRGVAVQQYGGLFGMSTETASKLVKALESEAHSGLPHLCYVS